MNAKKESKELSMREIQETSLDVLMHIHNLCKKLGLRYYLAYGTLIGAIRHKGFIPWDDDVDIMMPRDDYKKLIQYFMENEKELYPLKLFSYYNDMDYPYMISRISDDRYWLDVDNEKDYGIGVFVDVYPLDGVGNSESEYTKRKKRASNYSSLCYLSTREHFEIGTTKSKIKKIIKYPAYLYAKMTGKDAFLKKLEKMAKEKSYDECEFVGCLVWGTDGIKAVFPKEWLAETTLVEFEGKEFFAPKMYDEVLSRLYGDYMKLPPEEKRISHHFYRAYRKEE